MRDDLILLRDYLATELKFKRYLLMLLSHQNQKGSNRDQKGN